MKASVFLLVLIALFLVCIPVAFALGLTSTMMMSVTSAGVKFGIIIQRIIGGVNSFTLLAVPLFLLAGKLMNATTTTDRLFNFAKVLVGWLPGGLGHVNVLGSVIFAGMSGTAVSDAGGLGVIEIRAMNVGGFDNPFSCATTAASATLGPIIPPSLPMVVYGSMSGASVGALFLAGILPGFLMAFIMMIVVALYTIVRKYPREKFPTLKECVVGFKDAFLPLMAPVILLSGIYSGIFTPTEAAAIVVVFALILGMIAYRTLSFKGLWDLLAETAVDTAAIGLIVGAATLFGDVVIKTLVPQYLLQLVTSSITTPWVLLLVINIFLLIVGMFLETVAAITITVPLLMPLLLAAHVNLVHFGVIMVLNLMIGVLTPPFGIVLFVVSYVGKISVAALTRALIPWIIALIVCLMIVTYVPEISLAIPRAAGLLH